MSQAAFENYVPGGRQAASRSGGPAFENYVTGRNLNGGPGGMSNSWDTPFYRNFISGYQSAMDNGSAGSYFLNRKTGIALANQEGVDDSGMRQVVRAGDVYDEGKLVGNVYDQYGGEQADLILGQLWLSGQEQAKGVRIADKRAEVEQDMSARVGRERFDAEVEGIKKEWGDTADWAAPLGGGLGGAAVGASAGAAIGAAFGGVGAVPGALIGGIIGGLGLGAVGAVGAGMNRDELEDAAARGEAQARMLDREGLGGAGFSTRLQTWSMLAGEAANPLKQAVHGAAEVMIDGNAVGDDQSAFYSTNADGTLKRDAVWTGVDVAAGLGGAALQFTSPLGRLAFQGQMLGQIGGKTGTLAMTGGTSFDERTGQFDNIFTSEDGSINIGSGLAGLGEIGIDVLQLGMGRGLGKYAKNSWGLTGAKAGADGTRSVVESGLKFTVDAGGKAVGTVRPTISMMAPSELVQAMAVRATAQLTKGSAGKLTPDDLYRAAVNLANGSSLRKAALVNGFGEASEEAVQVALEAMSHEQRFTLEEMAQAALMGGAMGVGMTIGSRAGARSTDQRQLDQANTMRELMGREQLDRAAWKKMSKAERATALAIPPQASETLVAAANQTAQMATTDFVAGNAAVERVADAQHAMKARDQAKANDNVDGTYVISKAQHNIDDHMVVASIETVHDLLARNVRGLTEQLNTSPDQEAQLKLGRTLAKAQELQANAERAVAQFYAEGTSPAQQANLVRRLNQILAHTYEVNPDDVTTIDSAKAASLTFLRNPADNSGSFQGLLPQASLENSRQRANGFLQMTLGPTQAMGGDFDGDKISLASRVELDDDVFKAMRTGRTLLGALDKSGVNVMQRVFEEQEFILLGKAFRSNNAAVLKNAAKVHEDLGTFLRQTLRTPDGPFAEKLVTRFLGAVSSGNPKAKTELFDALAREFPAEMREVGEASWRNPWFQINSFVHQRLQQFQFAQAARISPAAKRGLAAPIPLDSEVGSFVARSAASFTQSMSFEVLGSDIFRKWQSLHYSSYNSPELTAAVADPATLQEMIALYEALSSGKAGSDLIHLLSKDDVTAKVASQLMKLSASTSADFNGRRAAIPLLANLTVPDLQGGAFHGKTSLVQWLLREAADAKESELRSMGTWDRDTDMQAKLNRQRRMNAGEAFSEVFGSWSMYDMLGMDSAVFGENITVDQFLASYSNQSDFNKSETAKQLKMHASYKAMNREQGRHNLPYYVTDLEGEYAITPYQAMVDALLQAGNNKITWNSGKGEVGGRIGDASNRASNDFREGVRSLQKAAVDWGVKVNSPAAWRAFLDNRPDVARAFFAQISDSAVDAVFHVDKAGKVHAARWVYGMLSMSSERAEMEFFRQTLLATWRARVLEDDETGAHARSYSMLTDRLHQKMYQLAKDDRTFQQQRFNQALFEMEDVNDFIAFVNNEIRDNEAPYTAWNRDVAEIDPAATKGGWSQILEGSSQREAMATFRTKAEQLVSDVTNELIREETDDVLAGELRRAIADPNASSRQLLENLRRALSFSQEFRASMGPAAMQRANLGALLGIMGHMTDKGQSAPMVEVNGVYDAKGRSLTFGTGEEIAWTSLTANSTTEAGQDPTLLGMDDFTMIAPDGRLVDWSKLTAEQFVEMWENKENRPFLRAVVFPSVYEHTMDGRLDQVSILDLSLTSLVTGNAMHDVLYSNSTHGKNVYLSMIEGIAGKQAVQRYINEYVVSHLGGRANTLQSPAEAEMLLREAYQTLAEVLRDAGELAQTFPTIDGASVNALDIAREQLRKRMRDAQIERKFGNKHVKDAITDALEILRADLNYNTQHDDTEEAADRQLKQLELLEQMSETSSARSIALAYSLPSLDKKEKESAWLKRTKDRRIELVRYVRSGMAINTQARWASGLDKILNDKSKKPDSLPELSVSEWVDVTRAIVANEIQLLASTTIPGVENVRVGNPKKTDWIRLHDPSFEYLLDILDPANPMVQASVKLFKHFNRPERGRVLEGDLVNKMMNTIVNPEKLGVWDDRIAEQIQQGNDRIDSSGAPQGISQGGLGPQNETMEGVATRRTTEVPEQKLRSSLVIKPQQLRSGKDQSVGVLRANGRTEQMHLSLLDGRFADEIIVTLDDGSTLDLLKVGRPAPGLSYERGPETDYEAVTVKRIAAALRSLPNATSVEVRFLHPADQPAGPEWANNVYFEGTVLETDGDHYTSLDAAWWFSPGGIDPESSAQSLGASKKKLKALKEVARVTHAQKLALEAGWNVDLFGMLQAKTDKLMKLDLGDGRRIDPSFRNAALKKLKMRHLVRGLDADGNVQVLTAEQVITLQQAGQPIPLTNPELYILSDPALRTMLGEPGTRGELRVATGEPVLDISTLQTWTGEITAANLANLPGMLELNPVNLFDTAAARRRTPRKLSSMSGADPATVSSYQRNLMVEQQVTAEVGQERAQANNPKMYHDGLSNAIDHASDAIGGRLHLDMARTARGLPSTPDMESFTKVVDQAILSHKADRMLQQSNATGFIFRFRVPREGTKAAFGEIYGVEALDRDPKTKHSWVAKGDLVSIDLDSAEGASKEEVRRALNWFMSSGAVIALSSKTNGLAKMQAAEYMLERGYERIEGSATLFERRDPSTMPITVQARYDRLMETGGVETANLVTFVQTNHFGLEENTGFLTKQAQNRRVVAAVDLVPTMAWKNFGLPLPQDMDAIRLRLTDDTIPQLVRQSELAAGRPLTKAEEASLASSIRKAAEALNDRGLYDGGTEFAIGDIIPLYNRRTQQLVLYRHGHKPPTDFADQFAQGNTAVYLPTLLPAATTHTGEVVRFDRTNRYGLRVLMKIPLQALADKTVIEGSGFKVVSISGLDEYDAAKNLEIPTGISGWDISHVIGIADSISKENYTGRVDNFRDAFTYLGIDFRPTLAEFLFGANYTDAQISNIAKTLEAVRRGLPKLSVAEVDQMMKSQNIAAVYRTQLGSLDGQAELGLGLREGWADDLVDSNTPQGRIARAMMLYLMTDNSMVEHILYSGGLNNTNAFESGLFTREMPRLFTQVFDRTPSDDPLRGYLVKKLNDRFDNPGAPYGWSMDNNFVVTFHNPNPEHTFDGYLQFAQAGSSGDNPVINLMAQDRQNSQTASSQQIAMAQLGLGSRTASTKQLDKTAAHYRQQQLQKSDTGADLLALLNAVPNEDLVKTPIVKTPAEREYDLAGRLVVDSLRQEIDTSDWTDEERIAFDGDRTRLAARYGITGYESLVDYWIRYHYYTRVDEKSEEEGGNPGRVSAAAAREAIARMERNHADGLYPTADGMVTSMHPVDVQVLHRAFTEGRGSFRLKSGDQTPTSLEDWVRVALGLADPEAPSFNLLALTAIDGNIHLYRDLGLGLDKLPGSLYQARAEQLIDPATQELMTSLSPDRARTLSEVEVISARATLEDVFGGSRIGLSWQGKEPAGTAKGQMLRKQWAWMKEEGMARPVGHSTVDLLTHGIRMETDGTVMNGFLRSLINLRAFLALANPMLTIGAPIEQFIQGVSEDITNLLTGNASASRLPGSSDDSKFDVKQMRTQIDALAQNQKMKSLLFGEFAMDEQLFNASKFEKFTHGLAKFGGKMQDPYYKMRANTIVRRYVESAVRAFQDTGSSTNMTGEMLVRALSTNPMYLVRNHPAIHQMAANTVREMKNMKDTSLALGLKGVIDPLTTSSNLLVSTGSVLTLKLPFMFAGYTSSKIIQLLGLQAADQAMALMLHGRTKPKLIGWLQAKANGREYTGEEDTFDMSSVIETVDLTTAFVKSGVTHSSLMALGLMSGGLGLSGEDEEDRRRRKAARAKGFAYLYDPRDIVNDFRNADAIYLDWLPPFISDMFQVTKEGDPGGARSMANMNWLLRQVFSPMLGMERFFNTGNPMEIWWGFEDAFYSFPLINSQLVKDAEQVFIELANSALDEEAIGTPESLPKAFGFWVKSVANLERMLLESSFINMLYAASDPYDRDAWVRVERGEDGGIVRNKLGIPEPTTALRDYVNNDGQVAQGYLGHDWMTATVRGYAENRATLALLGSLYGKLTGGDSMMRGDMAVKTRKIAKPEVTIEEAEAHLISLYKGVLKPGDPALENLYIPLDMRHQIETRFKKHLIDEGLRMFDGDQRKAEARMWDLWKGDASDPNNANVLKLKDVVYSKEYVSYKPTSKYYQLNTTYVTGPDGRPWATGIDRHSLANLAGIAPLQRFIATNDKASGTDSRLNYVDKAGQINTGQRGLMKVDESFEIDDEGAAAINAATSQPNSGWQDFGNGWKNFGSGWRNFKRRSGGGGGGGGGSAARLQAPQDQQVPYANEIQNVNISNPIIRRASIRRERADSQRGRLNQWQ